MEQLAAQQQDLATAGMELEHMQREALSKQEQDKVIRGKVILALVAFLASLHITLCSRMQWLTFSLSCKTCGLNLKSL